MDPRILEIVDRCRKSPIWFAENLCKIEHPAAGIIPFKLFSYQRKSLDLFFQHRMTIYRKNRQAGASSLCGLFALWFVMFSKSKNVLITSIGDREAKAFLNKNVKFIYFHLPPWMQELFPLSINNEHEFGFARTGSKITSLPAGPNVLRSHSSSLNIIDEAAFTKFMEAMWSAGYPTLTHGGRVICISTVGGIGGWYWSTYMDAKAGTNDFHPIDINWWDMDWVIEYVDTVDGKKRRIAPRDGIRKSTKDEVPIFGEWWSPWLQDQYRQLQSKGEAHKFRQEVLAEFLGSGSTVVPLQQLQHVEVCVRNAPPKKTIDLVSYSNPEAAIKDKTLNFAYELWVWKEPVLGGEQRLVNGKILGDPGHHYTMAVDPSTGEDRDQSGIEIIDDDAMEQVAEYAGKVDATTLAMMADHLGRRYNGAKMVVERNGYGMAVLQQLRDNLHYPNLWREIKGPNQVSEYGWKTTVNTKPAINTHLIDGVTDVTIYSSRLYKQLSIYVNLRGTKFGHEPGAGNHDDLVLAFGIALMGRCSTTPEPILAVRPSDLPEMNDPELRNRFMAEMNQIGGPKAMLPFVGAPMPFGENSDLDNFTKQLTGAPKPLPMVVPRRNVLEKPK